MIKPTILVTRPEPGLHVTAAKLREIGCDVILLPFTQMTGLVVPDLTLRAKKTDGILVTSANALRYMPCKTIELIEDIPVYCVGDATMETAFKSGFKYVHSANGHAQDLVDFVLNKVSRPSHFLYLCGQTRTTDIEHAFDRSNHRLDVVETYKTDIISQLTDKLKGVFGCNNISGICLYSRVSAKILNTYLEEIKISQPIEKINFFCISKKAANILSKDFTPQIVICDEPRDDAMIQAIKSFYCLV